MVAIIIGAVLGILVGLLTLKDNSKSNDNHKREN